MDNDFLKSLLKQLPKAPGVYQYKNKDNQIIYIGKAKNLYNRVNSYFRGRKDTKTKALVKKIEHIEYFLTNNETEALILENNLIKQHSPRYNIALKDSKSYPYIKITNENLPRIYKSRELVNKSGIFFGPFVSSETVDTIILILNKTLKLRKCRKKFSPPYNKQPCLNYHIGLCSAPCSSLISESEYLIKIRTAIEYLKGNTSEIINVLTDEMQKLSRDMKFEKAALIRDQITQIKSIKNEQFMESNNSENYDYIGFCTEFDAVAVSIIIVRSGKVADKKSYIFSNIIDNSTIISDFIIRYYLNTEFIPEKVFMLEDFDEVKSLTSIIKNRFNVNIKFEKPAAVKDKRLTKLSIDNAAIFYEEKKLKLDKIHHLRDLKKILNLSKIPRRIECIDIATLDGKYNTAAISVFIDGEPDRTLYRQYNIAGEGHPDDYNMMREVVSRRYQKMIVKNEIFPDLIVIDGGKGQLSAVTEIFDILKIEASVIGIAKKEEEIFTVFSKKPIKLPRESFALKIIQAIRDESHRFSNTRLRKRYKNSTLTTELLKINGIGMKRSLLLIKTFKSLNKIKSLSIKELSNTEGIGADLAEKIYKYFH